MNSGPLVERGMDKQLGPPFHGTRCALDPDASSYWREHWLLTGLIDIDRLFGRHVARSMTSEGFKYFRLVASVCLYSLLHGRF